MSFIILFSMLPATTSPFCQYLHDFMQTCEKFEEIYQLSKNSFNNLLKEKSKITAFNYLKNEKIRQTKIMDLKYSKLEMQEYLLDGDRNSNISNRILKARGKTLDIKLQKK